MSSLLHSASRSRLSVRLVTQARHSSGPPPETSDPKREIIRRVLYPSNIKNSTATPIGTWRPNVGEAIVRAIPSAEAHETIERAWLLHKRHLRKQREAETARKFECMKKAMDLLHDLDQQLYLEANRPVDPRARSPAEREAMKTMKMSEVRALESRIRGLFPRELRIPTDTPSRTGWNYEWKPFRRPL